MNIRLAVLVIFSVPFFTSSANAQAFSFSETKTVIGMTGTHTVEKNESLIEIARKFGLGFNEITAANPAVDPFIPGAETAITLPTSWILPDVESRSGIVINLSEMRLYYFLKKNGSDLAMTFPIGIGTEGNDTPEGIFSVAEKIEKPSWHVPESILKEKPDLPRVVPPGPDNPLGSHALRLSRGDILIHGTNRPYGVGRRVSHGCIRLYPEHISQVFRLVTNGTKVTIVKQPVKVGKRDGRIYLEVHKDKSMKINFFDEAVGLLRKKNLYEDIDKEKMLSALRAKQGIPVDISR
ncbi:MAG: L,D-transpeptidase family protein [Nitrospirota bacterium]